jgi:valyl-tRNA synthetase
MDLADRWILSRFHSTALEIDASVATFEVNKTTKTIFDFIWHDFADWYLEMIKSRLYGDESTEVKNAVLRRAIDLFDASLRLLHPIMPFVTEELWQNLRPRDPGASIMRARFAAIQRSLIDTKVESEMAFVQKVIEAVRTIRGEMGIPPSRDIRLLMRVGHLVTDTEFRAYERYVTRLARVHEITYLSGTDRPKLSAAALVEGEELFVPLEGLVDVEKERRRLMKEIDRVQSLIAGLSAKLQNRSFLERAPADIVEKEREKLQDFTRTVEKLRRNYDSLDS